MVVWRSFESDKADIVNNHQPPSRHHWTQKFAVKLSILESLYIIMTQCRTLAILGRLLYAPAYQQPETSNQHARPSLPLSLPIISIIAACPFYHHLQFQTAAAYPPLPTGFRSCACLHTLHNKTSSASTQIDSIWCHCERMRKIIHSLSFSRFALCPLYSHLVMDFDRLYAKWDGCLFKYRLCVCEHWLFALYPNPFLYVVYSPISAHIEYNDYGDHILCIPLSH